MYHESLGPGNIVGLNYPHQWFMFLEVDPEFFVHGPYEIDVEAQIVFDFGSIQSLQGVEWEQLVARLET